MIAGQLRTGILSLLMALAVCGSSIASAWDNSDYIDNNSVHIRQIDSPATDVDEVRLTKIIHPPVIIICPTPLQLPKPADSPVASPPTVQATHYPLRCITASFPSRASPPC